MGQAARLMSLERLKSLAEAGFIIFFLAAAGDGYLTYMGLAGSVELEGNPVMKGAMSTVGILPALIATKTIVGAVLWFLAVFVGRSIHESRDWVWKVPMLPAVREWMKAGDRCWIALMPLYGVAFGQLVAAFMWSAL